MRPIEIPVLVVGAGPVGLMASVLLAGRGIENLVVDRRDGPHRAPQAHVANPRTLEICRAAGFDMERLRAASTPREDGSHVAWVTTLAGEELGRLPYERQGDENLTITPTPLLNLPQHRFEPILLERVEREPRSEVRYRHRWVSLDQDTGGVTARIDDLASGETLEVRCRYLIAADGAGSRIRNALGIDMIGPDRIQSFAMIHFEADLRAIVRDRPAMLYWVLDPEVAGVFVAHDIDRTWVFMHPYDPDAESDAAYTVETCAAIVRNAIGADEAVAVTIRDTSFWTMTAQVAARYARERVFLAGDSAHRFPPSGGMGMNSGIQDAHNLIWKVAAVEEGWAPRSLLATYEVERRPVAQTNADQSVNNAMKMWEVLQALGIVLDDPGGSKQRMEAALADPHARERLAEAIEHQREHFDMIGLQLGFRYETGAVAAEDESPASLASAGPASEYVPTTAPGARLPHAWIERDGARISTLDLVAYDGFTLLAGPDASGWVAAGKKVGQVPLRVLVSGRDFSDPTGAWTAASQIGRDGALLVRPDQHVAWRSRSARPDAARLLESAVSLTLGGPQLAPSRA